ncbi:MAG: DUF1223 domain-containing protein [Pseudomonadota bacterium]
MPKTVLIVTLSLGSALLALMGFSQTSLAQGQAAAPSSDPVLVELFTSQGCSSCPPADRLAQRLAKEEGLVIVSRPVDYWDRLGWKDTLASPENTALQRAYAARGLGGYNGVYTPQTVVDGAFGEVGSDERALRSQIRQARTLDHRAKLHAIPVEGKGFAIGLAGSPKVPADLMLLGVASKRAIAIERGENRGRTVRYTNALVGKTRVHHWIGGKDSVAVTSAQLSMQGADRYAIVLREPRGGRVLAARWLE